MDRRTKTAIISFVTVLAVASLALFILLRPSDVSESPETQGNISVPRTTSQQYMQAFDKIKSNFNVDLFYEESTTVVYNCESSVHVCNYGTDRLQISADSAIKIGQHNIGFQTAFQGATGYLNVADSSFSGSMSVHDFYRRFSPITLFDTKLYKVISSQSTPDGLEIYFQQPLGGEVWAIPDGAVLEEAQGTALLKQGELAESVYTITYKMGSTVHSRTYRAYFTPCEEPVVLPDANSYTHVSSPEAALLLEQAYGYLMMMSDISANINDQISCETFGDELNKVTTLTTSGNVENFRASLNISMQQKNTSRGGEITQKSQSVIYENGIYTMIIDNGEPSSKTTITPGYMQSFCKDYLVGTILLPSEISDITLEETENSYIYHFTSSSETLAGRIRQRASQELYGETGFLENMYITDSLGGYLTIDKHSGLPISSGIHYIGMHQFDGNPYKLTFNTDQTYSN